MLDWTLCYLLPYALWVIFFWLGFKTCQAAWNCPLSMVKGIEFDSTHLEKCSHTNIFYANWSWLLLLLSKVRRWLICLRPDAENCFPIHRVCLIHMYQSHLNLLRPEKSLWGALTATTGNYPDLRLSGHYSPTKLKVDSPLQFFLVRSNIISCTAQIAY